MAKLVKYDQHDKRVYERNRLGAHRSQCSAFPTIPNSDGLNKLRSINTASRSASYTAFPSAHRVNSAMRGSVR